MRVRYCSTIAREVTRRCSMAVCSSGIVASTTVNGLFPPSGSPLGLPWPATVGAPARRATGPRRTAGRTMVPPILRLPVPAAQRSGHVTMAAMSDAPAGSESHAGLSKHRLEALTDGIFAVAMTLLVIELKLPEHATVHDPSDLAIGVLGLIPIFVGWIISFFVLAIFWFSHHRLFHHLRIVDGRLLWLNILYLSFVSLMPFSSALAGAYSRMLFSPWFYSSHMLLLVILGLLI